MSQENKLRNEMIQLLPELIDALRDQQAFAGTRARAIELLDTLVLEEYNENLIEALNPSSAAIQYHRE